MRVLEALNADRAGELEAAAMLYEEVLAAGERPLQVLLNLSLLYWQSTDVGMAAAKKLPPVFLDLASRRFPELLDEAQVRFPQSTEVRFWRRYIAWADLGEPFDSSECKQLLREDPTTLIGAMYLFASSQGSEAQPEAAELLRECREDRTTRARYVISVIEGVMNRATQRR